MFRATFNIFLNSDFLYKSQNSDIESSILRMKSESWD